MSGWLDADGERLRGRVVGLVRDRSWSVSEAEVDALGVALARWQRDHNAAYRRLWDATLGERDVVALDDVPAVPTDVFKVARMASFAERFDRRVFYTSGTTQDVRGAHPFADLSLYDEACVAIAERLLLPRARYRCVFVAESEADAPQSSLTYMLARFAERWGDGREAFFVRGQRVSVDAVRGALEEAVSQNTPVAFLGTSFGFVHLHDAVGDWTATLPFGSVAMLTGGFKGRSRTVDPAEMRAMLRARLGPLVGVAAEYGMTELTSQCYDRGASGGAPGVYVAPPWMRVTMVDPVGLRPVPKGEVGLVRVVDLTNLGSVAAIQTSDLGRTTDEGFEVLGRAEGATPRGCARAMDALLSPG